MISTEPVLQITDWTNALCNSDVLMKAFKCTLALVVTVGSPALLNVKLLTDV